MSDVMERPDTTFVRWTAHVFYRSENGLIDVQHDMEELEELQDLVERGPNWDTIEKIEIKRAVPSEDLITIEEAQRL